MEKQEKLAVGSDHGGFHLKQQVIEWLQEWGYDVCDFGTVDEQSVDYPDYAVQVARAVASGECTKGILVCGTGIGMAITANKIKGVRAASVSDVFSARMFREHNNGNVLCLGARVVGSGLAREIIKAYLEATFAGGRHERRVSKIMTLEK